jgi:hypothetical protein
MPTRGHTLRCSCAKLVPEAFSEGAIEASQVGVGTLSHFKSVAMRASRITSSPLKARGRATH